MKIGLQPAIYTSPKNTQITKNDFAQTRQTKTPALFDAQPTFTGRGGKLIPFVAAMSASLILLAGCTQQKPNINTMGGTGYRPDPPSYRTEEQAPTSAGNNPSKISPSTPDDTEVPIIETPATNRTPAGSSQTGTYPQNSEDEMSETEIKLRIHYSELETIRNKLGQINNDLATAQNELEIKQAELEKAEEKLTSYDRKSPSDKPPGFEADFDIYTDICLEVKRLESIISDLEADKAAAEAKQDELIAAVSELGGHPHRTN